jgi:hypothetical protein
MESQISKGPQHHWVQQELGHLWFMDPYSKDMPVPPNFWLLSKLKNRVNTPNSELHEKYIKFDLGWLQTLKKSCFKAFLVPGGKGAQQFIKNGDGMLKMCLHS